MLQKIFMNILIDRLLFKTSMQPKNIYIFINVYHLVLKKSSKKKDIKIFYKQKEEAYG